MLMRMPDSRGVGRALGYEEVGRVVCFKKDLV